MRKLFYLVVLLATSVFAQHTYYISISAGSDTNTSTQAQSKATPWAHFSGMANTSSNAASYTPVAGDSFVLMGCDVWPNASFPITWSWSGSSGNVITVGGTDHTWYNATNCPSSWNRPIFDYGGSVLSTNATNNTLISMGSNGYVQWSWIEHKHVWNGSTTTSYQGNDCVTTAGSGVIIDHWYVHAWVHTGATSDSFQCFSGSTNTPYNAGSLLEYNVFNGSDSTNGGDSGAFMYVWPNAKYNVVNNATNAIYGPLGTAGGEIGSNRLTNINTSFDGSVHENCIEILVGAGNSNGTFYIHDNLLSNCVGEEITVGNPNETDYIWNNVVYGNMGNMIHLDEPAGVSMYFFNNTLVPRSSLECFNVGPGTWSGVIVAENNHCITTATGGAYSNLASTTFSATGGVTVSNNLVQTPTVADENLSPNFDQYSSSQTFVYSPVASTNSTIGAGANLTSSWPGGYVTSDTTYACSESTVSGVVESVCPARTSNTRPTGATAWDIGAYQFGSQASPSSCSPGSGTYSSTQTVSLNNPNTGTTVVCYNTTGSPATNGDGATCPGGSTKYTTPLSISTNETLYSVAGTSTLTDSSVTSCVYAFTTTGASGTIGNGAQLLNGASIH